MVAINELQSSIHVKNSIWANRTKFVIMRKWIKQQWNIIQLDILILNRRQNIHQIRCLSTQQIQCQYCSHLLSRNNQVEKNFIKNNPFYDEMCHIFHLSTSIRSINVHYQFLSTFKFKWFMFTHSQWSDQRQQWSFAWIVIKMYWLDWNMKRRCEHTRWRCYAAYLGR